MSSTENFALARRFHHHIAIHDADRALDPPESYLFIHDILVLSCAISWTLFYLFAIRDTLRHGRSLIPTHAKAFNLSYDFYFAVVIPQATAGTIVYLSGWFAPNTVWVAVTIYMTKPNERMRVLGTIIVETVALLLLYRFTSIYVPDQQCRAYWFGILAFIVDTAGATYQTCKYGNSDCLSHGMRLSTFLGTLSAQGVFFWRYFNVPDNWSYVASPGSLFAWSACWLLGIILHIAGFMYRLGEGKGKLD